MTFGHRAHIGLKGVGKCHAASCFEGVAVYSARMRATRSGSMSVTGESMQTDPSALAVAITALKGSADLLTLMARKGLISPDEVDEYADGLMGVLHREPGDPLAPMMQLIREHAEHTLSGPLALAKSAARASWKGG